MLKIGGPNPSFDIFLAENKWESLVLHYGVTLPRRITNLDFSGTIEVNVLGGLSFCCMVNTNMYACGVSVIIPIALMHALAEVKRGYSVYPQQLNVNRCYVCCITSGNIVWANNIDRKCNHKVKLAEKGGLKPKPLTG